MVAKRSLPDHLCIFQQVLTEEMSEAIILNDLVFKEASADYKNGNTHVVLCLDFSLFPG